MIKELFDTGSGDIDYFLMQINRNGKLLAHGVVTLSELTGRIAGQQYADVAGEEPDAINAWHLGEGVPTPVKIRFKRHSAIGFMEVVFRWHQPGFGSRSESAYFRLLDA